MRIRTKKYARGSIVSVLPLIRCIPTIKRKSIDRFDFRFPTFSVELYPHAFLPQNKLARSLTTQLNFSFKYLQIINVLSFAVTNMEYQYYSTGFKIKGAVFFNFS